MVKFDKQRINKAMEIADNVSSLKALDSLPEMNKLEIVNKYDIPGPLKNTLKIVLFNIERGKYLEEILAYMKYHPALKESDVIFFNELDYGMFRTGNKNIAAEISNRLSLNYIFGVEFLELMIGDKEGENKEAFHGNAIMSRFKLYDQMLLRLPLVYDWYKDKQKRIGTRIAVFAKIAVNSKEIGLVCTHLENRTSPLLRKVQMMSILEQAEKIFRNIPIIIAGDMNTNTFDGSNASEAARMLDVFKAESDRVNMPEKYEPLFELVESYGYDYKHSNMPGKITRRKPIPERGTLEMNLDWFFTRGVTCFETAVVNTIFKQVELPGISGMEVSEGIQISDHNAISVSIVLC